MSSRKRKRSGKLKLLLFILSVIAVVSVTSYLRGCGSTIFSSIVNTNNEHIKGSIIDDNTSINKSLQATRDQLQTLRLQVNQILRRDGDAVSGSDHERNNNTLTTTFIDIPTNTKAYQYTPDDILHILLEMSEYQKLYKVAVVKATDATQKHPENSYEKLLQDTITSTIEYLLKYPKHPPTVVLPINLTAITADHVTASSSVPAEKTASVSVIPSIMHTQVVDTTTPLPHHWVSIVIKRTNKDELSVFYHDSVGGPINNIVSNLLESSVSQIKATKKPKIHIKNTYSLRRKLSDKANINNYDLAPLAILNLHALAMTSKSYLPSVIDTSTKYSISSVSNIVENQRKFLALHHIEQDYYKPLLQQLADAKTIETRAILIQIMEALGEIVLGKAELSKILGFPTSIHHLTDAAIFYHNVISLLNQEIDKSEESLKNLQTTYLSVAKLEQYKLAIKEYKKKLHHIYHEVIKTIVSEQIGIAHPKSLSPVSETALYSAITEDELSVYHKQILIDLRNYSKEKLKEIEKYRIEDERDDLYISHSQELFKYVTTTLKQLLASLYQETETELKTIGISPPQIKVQDPNNPNKILFQDISYSVIGLGSIAFNQATPYSDFEFAILMGSTGVNKQQEEQMRSYLRNLTHLVHWKIINLGETIIPASKYEVDLGHLISRGVNFDLGGKTPLGRVDHDKSYDLIQTIAGMMHYVRDKDDTVTHIDKYLPVVLEKFCFIYGDPKLAKAFQNRVITFLASKDSRGKPIRESRAISNLKNGVLEIDYLQTKQVKQTTGYLKQFTDTFDSTSNKTFHVKELYRLLDRFIYNLGLYFGVLEAGAFEATERLMKKQIIDQQISQNLKFAMTFANILRLKSYLRSNSFQSEDTSMLELSKDSGFTRYISIVSQLVNSLEELCKKHAGL
jgi:hypothetical protein